MTLGTSRVKSNQGPRGASRSSKLLRTCGTVTLILLLEQRIHFDATWMVQKQRTVGKHFISSFVALGVKRKKKASDNMVTESTRLRSSPQYGSDSYWDDRYRDQSSPYEWIGDYSDLRDIIDNATAGNTSCRILNVGCGSSTLSEEMYDSGYCKISNIDMSATVVEQMKLRSKNRSMWWYQMDATHMAFVQESFDLIIDKSLLDTLLCANKHEWLLSKYLEEVSRVLAPGGKFMCISFGRPANRLPAMEPLLQKFSKEVIELPPKNTSSYEDTLLDILTVLGHLNEYSASLASGNGTSSTTDSGNFRSKALVRRSAGESNYVYMFEKN